MSSSVDDPSNNSQITKPEKLFNCQRPIHDVLGGGNVANLLLWRNPKVSFLVLIGVTYLWLLFEVIEYNLVTFFCHLLITTMLVSFIRCTLSDIFKWNTPQASTIALDESTMQGVATILYNNLNRLLTKFLDIATGKDPKPFFLVIGMLWFMSIVGNYISALNLIYIGYLFLQSMPILYEMYEDDVDSISRKMIVELMRLYEKLDSSVLRRIPRGPRKEKKRK
ncbi:hypothetical protein V2J09_014876 [Rumex salicifolius]